MAVPAFQLVQTMGNVLWLAAVVLWLFLLLKTWQGETWRVPLAGDLAKKIAGTIRKAAQRAAIPVSGSEIRYSVFGTSIFGTDFGFTVPLACTKLKLLLAMRGFAAWSA